MPRYWSRRSFAITLTLTLTLTQRSDDNLSAFPPSNLFARCFFSPFFCDRVCQGCRERTQRNVSPRQCSPHRDLGQQQEQARTSRRVQGEERAVLRWTGLHQVIRWKSCNCVMEVWHGRGGFETNGHSSVSKAVTSRSPGCCQVKSVVATWQDFDCCSSAPRVGKVCVEGAVRWMRFRVRVDELWRSCHDERSAPGNVRVMVIFPT